MSNNPSNLSAYKRAELIMHYYRNLIEGQLTGDIDIQNARRYWLNLLTDHKDDPDALAEALTWTLNKRLVTSKQ